MSAAPAETDTEAGSELAITDPGQVEMFAQMVTLIPMENEGDWTNIFEQIFAAERIDSLNAPWDASKVAQLANRPLIIQEAKRRPSDYKAGMGFFLVLKCIDRKTGDKITVVNGSIAVIAQIVKAYAMGWMPLVAEFIIAERATKSGYHPHHLHVLGTGSSAKGQVIEDDNETA